MKSENKIFTYQTRLTLTEEEEAIFDSYGELMGQVERTLFAKISAKKEMNALKSEFLKKFQITARQFNSARVQVEGKIESIKKLRIHHIEESKERISPWKSSFSMLTPYTHTHAVENSSFNFCIMHFTSQCYNNWFTYKYDLFYFACIVP